MSVGRIRQLPGDERGATAIEFAFVLPIFLALVFGILNVSLLMLTVASLHHTVEKGARCASLKGGTCPEADLKGYYFAPGPAPKFTANASAACGRLLTATVVYNLNAVIYQKAVSLSATACFP
jgi:Flp pilus assembly protein TadG